MCKIVLFFLLTILPVSLSAQDDGFRKGNCLPALDQADQAAARGPMRRLPAIYTLWDKDRVYRQAVVLVNFRDVKFGMEKPRETYDSLFNFNGFKGYNKRVGVGCVAEYFREQSGGLCNLAFDVYGPVDIDTLANPYVNPDANTRNYGGEIFRTAMAKLAEANPDVNYKEYDWNNDGSVNQVIFIYAGMGGNQGAKSYGYVWPNTGTFSVLTLPGGVRVDDYTSSAEHWQNGVSCGLGTVCHEFSHSLGLPDLYPVPTSSDYYSVVDEWDLMDGGNFTNYGWCPPNYSPHEKMLMGWLKPTELSEPTTITGLKPVSEGGETYLIKKNGSQFWLLENRQWTGWDLGSPGCGLVVYAVDYNEASWRSNHVNANYTSPRYQLVHADGLDYNAWDNLLVARGMSSQYAKSPRLHNYHLSTSPFPWSTDSTATVNACPDAQLTNIRMTDDGLVSFDFMGGDPDAISSLVTRDLTPMVYDLNGRRVSDARRGVFIEVRPDGSIRKVLR